MQKFQTATMTSYASLWLGSLVVLWAFLGSFRDLPRVIKGLTFMTDYVGGMFPPDFSVLPSLAEPLRETVQSAISGVGLSACFAALLSFLAARNTSPGIVAYAACRGLIALLRGLPTLLWAILFVSMVGLGPLAGVFAITCHCTGTFSKLFSETIESTGPKVACILEAMRLDGAGEAQVIAYGLLPEVAPLFASYVVYYFEWAVRVGTILGLVGAGGIGLELTNAIRSFRRQESLAILLVILGLVVVIDQASRRVRDRLLRDW
jgi:phosphonate transport system permease protein